MRVQSQVSLSKAVLAQNMWSKIESVLMPLKKYIPPPTLTNLWITLATIVATQNLIAFTKTQITGNAITALIVWGGAVICLEDKLENFRPAPSLWSLPLGILLVLYSLYRVSVVNGSDSFLYLIVPLTGLGLLLLAVPWGNILDFKDSLIILCLLPLFLLTQIFSTSYISDDLSILTAKFVLFWLSVLGISPLKLVADTVLVNGGAVQVMHECNGFEMIMQMLITAIIFLIAFPLRSRIAKVSIFLISPIIGFTVNSLRIALLGVFTSFNSPKGVALFDFFHEQAGSLIFSGIAVFMLGYLYLAFLDRELPPISTS